MLLLPPPQSPERQFLSMVLKWGLSSGGLKVPPISVLPLNSLHHLYLFQPQTKLLFGASDSYDEMSLLSLIGFGHSLPPSPGASSRAPRTTCLMLIAMEAFAILHLVLAQHGSSSCLCKPRVWALISYFQGRQRSGLMPQKV